MSCDPIKRGTVGEWVGRLRQRTLGNGTAEKVTEGPHALRQGHTLVGLSHRWWHQQTDWDEEQLQWTSPTKSQVMAPTERLRWRTVRVDITHSHLVGLSHRWWHQETDWDENSYSGDDPQLPCRPVCPWCEETPPALAAWRGQTLSAARGLHPPTGLLSETHQHGLSSETSTWLSVWNTPTWLSV